MNELKKPLRRKTPIDADETDRILDRLNNQRIQDRDSFDLELATLFDQTSLSPSQLELADQLFPEYRKNHPRVSRERLFTGAGGKGTKGLLKDREFDNKEVVRSEKEFIKRGARNVDLKGFDTRKVKLDKRRKRLASQTVLGTIKGKTVFTTPEKVSIKGVKRTIYRDSRGRFAKRLK